MNELLLTRDLTQQGFNTDEIGRLARRGDLTRVRRGAYLRRAAAATGDPTDPDDFQSAHLRLVAGTWPQLHPRAVFSHGSAAAVHGLPLFRNALDHVHVTRDRQGGGVRRSVVFVHGSPLREEDRTVSDGLPVTSLARTTVDLARTLDYDQAVAVVDRALALGTDPTALAESLEQAQRWYGSPQARRAVAFGDARSESVGESYSRVRLHDLGLPAPTLQLEVFDRNGYLIGRADFGWQEHRTLGEFDGRTKYGGLRRPGESPEDVVHREKLREDALRDQGWEIARWDSDDLRRPEVIAGRLRRAFDRAAGRPLDGT
ncbi:MAG: hypothetical protein L0H24_09955 [Microlunatus sp.]|nr:hypothetical protein [Microlunatus sp.]